MDLKDNRDERLYLALPKADRILELGCGDGAMGKRYKQANPSAYWVGLDADPGHVKLAQAQLDKVLPLDLAARDLNVGGESDLIIIRDVLARMEDPLALLVALKHHNPCAKLICRAANMAHISIIEQLLTCDITYDQAGLFKDGKQHMFSQCSLFKLFLDAGWLPNLAEALVTEEPQRDFIPPCWQRRRPLAFQRTPPSVFTL